MRSISRGAMGLAVAILTVLTVGYLLPGTIVVSRTAVIAAPAQTVFPFVNNARQLAEWSPLLALDAAAQIDFSGPEEGIGSRLAWVSDDPRLGRGNQEILSSEQPRHVRARLAFDRRGDAEIRFDLEPRNAGTSVTWTFRAVSGSSPIDRWRGVLVGRRVGRIYEGGLATLKARLEVE